MTEREQIVAWLREQVLREPDWKGWRAVVWAVFHPYQFGRYFERIVGVASLAHAIERGDYRPAQSSPELQECVRLSLENDAALSRGDHMEKPDGE